jgi:hypothetical protein
MAYSKVRWISTPAFLACVGGIHGRGDGANICQGAQTAGGGAYVFGGVNGRGGGGACMVQRRAHIAGGAHRCTLGTNGSKGAHMPALREGGGARLCPGGGARTPSALRCGEGRACLHPGGPRTSAP